MASVPVKRVTRISRGIPARRSDRWCEERKEGYPEKSKEGRKEGIKSDKRWEKGSRWMAGTRKSDDGTFSHLSCRRRPTVHYLRRHVARGSDANCRVKLCLRRPEIRPRFGKAAGGFIFLPFVFTSVNVVAAVSPFSRG